MLKQCLRELGVKTELHITFIPDVIIACCLLHNLLLGQTQKDVEQLLDILQNEGMAPEVVDNRAVYLLAHGLPNLALGLADEKRL